MRVSDAGLIEAEDMASEMDSREKELIGDRERSLGLVVSPDAHRVVVVTSNCCEVSVVGAE